MKSNYKKIGDFIIQVKDKNKDNLYSELLGINIDKFFMPSVANVIGVDLSIYKVVRKNQFACNRMHVGRDYRIPISLSRREEPFLVSPAYDVFEIKDATVLLPEYLMMWFSRKEFDRKTWFYTDADVRGGLPWNSFCELELPIPSLENQLAIVKEYSTIVNRIELNEQLIQKLEDMTKTIYRQWFVDFEFPDKSGKPYKSNGGEMIWCEELRMEVPKGWKAQEIEKLATISAGGDKPKSFSEVKTEKYTIPIYSNGITAKGLYGYTDKANYPKHSITISARGTIGYCELRELDFDAIVRLIVLMPKEIKHSRYLFEFIKRIEFDNSGSVQNQLTKPQVSGIKILMPTQNIIHLFNQYISTISNKKEIEYQDNNLLKHLQELLLSKMTQS